MAPSRRFSAAAAVAALALAAPATLAQDPREDRPGADTLLVDVPARGATTAVGHAFHPRRVDATPARVRSLSAPDGFRVEVFAEDLGAPRMLAVSDDGTVWVTRPDSGDVLRLVDRDGDGRADERIVAVADLPGVHGVAVDGGRLFLADVNRVYVADLGAGGAVGEPRAIVDTLPDGGQHANRTLRLGPDGWLYVTVGSLTNQVPAPDANDALMLRVRPDGSGLETFARNLRNTLGFDWHPGSGEMWAMDHGIDWLGDDTQPEELNHIVEGGDYGWPHCFGEAVPNATRQPPEGFDSLEAYCRTTLPMTLGYQAHSAPMGMAFYTGDAFPAAYRGDAFVAMRGSWNRFPPVGYEVVRVRFDGSRPVAVEPFVTGWLVEGGAAHFGRVAGLAPSADGALLVSDDTNGVVYRIASGR